MKQQVILVDEENNQIGVEEKIKAHEEGKLHRAFSIFIFNSDNKLLIQQRQKSKYHSSELWSNSVCSHPQPGETFDDGAHRRLKEEIGFDCELKKLFCFIYNTGFKNKLIENEYDCVFMGKYNGDVKINQEEIMNYKWVSLDWLKDDINSNPEKYSVWLKIILEKTNYFDDLSGKC